MLAAHDITDFLDSTSAALYSHSPNPFFGEVPVTVVRSYGKDSDHGGLVLRFKVTNRHTSPVVIGGLGLPMCVGLDIVWFGVVVPGKRL